MYSFEDAYKIAKEQEIIASEEFKTLPDDELLNIWEHTQLVEMEVRQRFGASVAVAPNYEAMIVSELHNRLITNNILDIYYAKSLRNTSKKPRLKRRSPNPVGIKPL